MNESKISNILFFVLLGMVTLLFLFMIRPFFFPIFWAAVIAGIFQPVYLRLETRFHSPSMAAVVVMLVILVIIILPALVIGSLLLGESLDFYNNLDMGTVSIEQRARDIVKAMSENPYLSRFHIDTAALMGNIADGAKSIANYMFESLKEMTQNMVIFIAQFAIMLYTLFFFIRDGAEFLKKISSICPLGDDREKMLFDSFTRTARATLKVTLIIGGIQGLLGGLLFFILGVKGALTWGVVMVFSSIIPGVGCSIVWVPAALVMLMLGYVWKGAIIVAFGVLVISMVDNFLRPLLLGQDVQMHPLMIFLSTLGGIMLFGFSGFVLGPIITSLLLAFWRMYIGVYRNHAA